MKTALVAVLKNSWGLGAFSGQLLEESEPSGDNISQTLCPSWVLGAVVYGKYDQHCYVMVALSAMYSSKEEQLCWNNIIAFCSWGEFANTVSAGRTGLLRELLMPLFPSEYADGFNFHHIAPHFLPSGFPLWRSREQGSGWNFISPGRPCTLSVVSPNLCCSQALIFSTWWNINTSMRKLGNVSSQLDLSHRNLRAPWRLLWWYSQLFLFSLKQTEVPVSELPAVSEKLILSLIV